MKKKYGKPVVSVVDKLCDVICGSVNYVNDVYDDPWALVWRGEQ
jgi:hypothetical protein